MASGASIKPGELGEALHRKPALRGYSQGQVTAIDLRRRLGGATYGEVLSLLGAENLPLPRAPLHGREEQLLHGREEQLERARRWLFPTHEP